MLCLLPYIARKYVSWKFGGRKYAISKTNEYFHVQEENPYLDIWMSIILYWRYWRAILAGAHPISFIFGISTSIVLTPHRTQAISSGNWMNERAQRIRPSPAQCGTLKKTRSACVHFASSSGLLCSLSCCRAMVCLDFPLRQNRCLSVAVAQMRVACPYPAVHIHIGPCLTTMPVCQASSQGKDGLASGVGTQIPPANSLLPDGAHRPSEQAVVLVSLGTRCSEQLVLSLRIAR